MKYEILLLSILIVASYSSDCTEKTVLGTGNDDICTPLATTTDSGNTCCYVEFQYFDSTKDSCFEHKLSKTESTDLSDLDKIANAFLKNTTNIQEVKYKCKIEKNGDQKKYSIGNEISLCSGIQNPTSGDTCAAAYNETVSKNYGFHCCLLDYEISGEISGNLPSSGKMCQDLDNTSYNNITEYLEQAGTNGHHDRRLRHLDDDDDEDSSYTIKKFNINCGTGKPAGQSNGEKISGATQSAESGTTGITSDAKLVKTGVMILILSLLI